MALIFGTNTVPSKTSFFDGIPQNNEQNKMWIIARERCGPLHPTILRKVTGGNRTRDLPKFLQWLKPLDHRTLGKLQHS